MGFGRRNPEWQYQIMMKEWTFAGWAAIAGLGQVNNETIPVDLVKQHFIQHRVLDLQQPVYSFLGTVGHNQAKPEWMGIESKARRLGMVLTPGNAGGAAVVDHVLDGIAGRVLCHIIQKNRDVIMRRHKRGIHQAGLGLSHGYARTTAGQHQQ